MLYLAIIYFLFFSYLAWKNFRWAVGIFIISLPTYLIRFNIGPLPTTLLEVSFGALFLVWLFKYFKEDKKVIWKEMKKRKLLFLFIGLFFFSSVIGIFISDMWHASFGQWRAYFLEPLILFFILAGRLRADPLVNEKVFSAKGEIIHPVQNDRLNKKDIVCFLTLSSISVSVLAILQKVTGCFYPPSLWNDDLDGRAVAFFTSPNAVGLFLAPIAALVLSLYKEKKKYIIPVLFLILFAILFSFSQGAWVALAAGLVFFIFLMGYKKIAVVTVLIGLIIGLFAAPLRSAILFQDKSGQNRLELWSLSWNYLKSSPQNFIFGTGIRQFFRKIQKPVYEPKEMERLIYPHNFLLNFWTEIGFLGMLSFMVILICGFYNVFKLRKNNLLFNTAIVVSLVVWAVHGLVDVPYFKNDLAFLFWIIYVLSL